MRVGALELIHYWRLVAVFWASTFLSMAMFFIAISLFAPHSEWQGGDLGEHAYLIALISLIGTVLVMYFGSFIWWPLVVLWHWAMLKLKSKHGFLRVGVALSCAMFFVLATIACLLMENWTAVLQFGRTKIIAQYVFVLSLWAFATALIAGGLTWLAFCNTSEARA